MTMINTTQSRVDPGCGRTRIGRTRASPSATPAFAQDPAPRRAAGSDAAADRQRSRRHRQPHPRHRIRSAPTSSRSTQDKIAEEPVTSTNDLLRRVPQVVSLGANRAGGSAQNGAANATRGAGINLRGLSHQRDLAALRRQALAAAGHAGPVHRSLGHPLDRARPGRGRRRRRLRRLWFGRGRRRGQLHPAQGFRRASKARARYGFTDGDYDEKQVALIAGKRWDGGWMRWSPANIPGTIRSVRPRSRLLPERQSQPRRP